MTPGAILAVGCWGNLIALVGYGLSFDVRRWLEHRSVTENSNEIGYTFGYVDAYCPDELDDEPEFSVRIGADDPADPITLERLYNLPARRPHVS